MHAFKRPVGLGLSVSVCSLWYVSWVSIISWEGAVGRGGGATFRSNSGSTQHVLELQINSETVVLQCVQNVEM